MKKTLLALFISLLSGLAFSQTMINESFNGTTFPPTGWTNLEVPTPSTNVWDRVTSGSDPTCNTHSGAGMARYYAYNYANGKSAILATPVIDLSGLGLNVVRISTRSDKEKQSILLVI